MGYATIDTSQHPLIIIKFSEKEPTRAEFEEYLKSMESLYGTHSDFVIILDASATKYLSSELRIRQGQWMKEKEEIIKKSCKGMAFIIPSAMVRMLFNAIMLVQKLPAPHSIHSNFEDAKKWAMDLLKK